MNGVEDAVVVVADDTGRESADIVDTFLNASATVVYLSHTETIDDEAAEFTMSSDDDGLVTVAGDFEEVSVVERLYDDLLVRFGRIDALVISMGVQGHTGQRIVEMSLNTFWSALTGPLRRSFILTRTFYPSLGAASTRGHCVFINDANAEIPRSHAGPRCIAAAAQRMFTRELLEESSMSDDLPRISEICSYTWNESDSKSIVSNRNPKSPGAVAVDIVSGEANEFGDLLRI